MDDSHPSASAEDELVLLERIAQSALSAEFVRYLVAADEVKVPDGCDYIFPVRGWRGGLYASIGTLYPLLPRRNLSTIRETTADLQDRLPVQALCIGDDGTSARIVLRHDSGAIGEVWLFDIEEEDPEAGRESGLFFCAKSFGAWRESWELVRYDKPK